MKYQKCACGNNKFDTTRTIYYEVKVIVLEDGIMDYRRDDDDEAEFQPDNPFGNYACTKCGKTYSDKELRRAENGQI